MPDDRLKTFLTVVRCGSLTQAARELHISQPAVTLQIHKLEAEYNDVLFYRHERGVELTAAGRTLHGYALRIDRLYQEAAEEISSRTGDMRGALRIGATLTIGEYVLPSVMGEFKTRHPGVEILLQVENTRRIVEQVAAGDVDLGMVEGPFDNGLVRAEKLSDDELVVLCAPGHRLAPCGQATLEDLMSEPFILREPGSGTRRVFEVALQQAGVDPGQMRVLIQLGSTHAIKALVSQNLGLSVLSEWTVKDELRSGALCAVAAPALDLRRPLNFIFQKDARLSLITRRFIRACRSRTAHLQQPVSD